jgi:hypothetical protein
LRWWGKKGMCDQRGGVSVMIYGVSDRVRIARAHMGGGRIRDSKIDSPDLHRNLPNQHGQETKTGQAKVRWEARVGWGTEVEGQAEGNGSGWMQESNCCPCLL